jgi:hypothetical protein
MAYDRNTRGPNPGDFYNRPDRDYGSGRDAGPPSGRGYQGGEFDRDERGGFDRGAYGARDDSRGGGRDGGRDRGRQEFGSTDYAQSFRERGGHSGPQSGRPNGYDDRQNHGGRSGGREGDRGGYAREPQGYDHDDRGFLDRAGDELRSWFGDEEAERRRDLDARRDGGPGDRHQHHRDADYHSWRQSQISQLDRDYEEYRRENRARFENEFTTWRTARQGQRDLLILVAEHMNVVGSDGAHVGTVDKVRGDRILLTRTDEDAGGRHHSIPSSWLKDIGTEVTLAKTADEAKKHWRDEERNREMQDEATGRDAQGRILNRSFSGTY